MKIELFFVGKTTEAFLRSGMDEYAKRLKHYIAVTEIVFEPSKNSKTDVSRAIKEESEKMLSKIKPSDFVIALDERGKAIDSVHLSSLIGNHQQNGTGKIIFLTGGAYGLDDTVRKRANLILSFSKFTFTHQMIRLLLMEQIYRAMTILKNEKYHH
jgi:23S rRNA (pseudouridine1915-N3)-methyltransferase